MFIKKKTILYWGSCIEFTYLLITHNIQHFFTPIKFFRRKKNNTEYNEKILYSFMLERINRRLNIQTVQT